MMWMDNITSAPDRVRDFVGEIACISGETGPTVLSWRESNDQTFVLGPVRVERSRSPSLASGLKGAAMGLMIGFSADALAHIQTAQGWPPWNGQGSWGAGTPTKSMGAGRAKSPCEWGSGERDSSDDPWFGAGGEGRLQALRVVDRRYGLLALDGLNAQEEP